jgi:lipid-A-disaccharide synthase
MAEVKNILIIAGEASGDLNASCLIKSLKEYDPALKISGVGGEAMREAGAEIFYDIKEISVIGLFDVLKKLPQFLSLKKLLLKKIEKEKVDAIILVDFSGFNLRLAKSINKKIPVIYYVSPQIWASRVRRIETVRKFVNKLIVLFKFEENFYKKYGIDVDFVGHPLLDIVKPQSDSKNFLDQQGLSSSKLTIALLPGSRKTEVENILPVMLKTAALIRKELPEVQFVVAKSKNVSWQAYNKNVGELKNNLKIIEGKTYDCLNISDFALVASGTATLETAILEKPFCIIYKMGILNYLLYRPQVKVPYIGMVNIVAGEKIIPEFVQFNASAKNISQEVIRILKNPEEKARIVDKLRQIKTTLGEHGAPERASRIILNFLGRI